MAASAAFKWYQGATIALHIRENTVLTQCAKCWGIAPWVTDSKGTAEVPPALPGIWAISRGGGGANRPLVQYPQHVSHTITHRWLPSLVPAVCTKRGERLEEQREDTEGNGEAQLQMRHCTPQSACSARLLSKADLGTKPGGEGVVACE